MPDVTTLLSRSQFLKLGVAGLASILLLGVPACGTGGEEEDQDQGGDGENQNGQDNGGDQDQDDQDDDQDH